MDKPNQAFEPDGTIPKDHILALSWNIATEPKLYRQLTPNPYSHTTQQIISERFPDASTVNIIRAVVLAEPEGKYDRNFKLFGAVQQAEELRKQRDISTEINKRLDQYYKKHAKELSRLPIEFVYDSLSKIVFGTTDLKKIEQRYSQNQRRDFRISIVNFIEDTQRLKPPYQQKDTDNSSIVGAFDEKLASIRPLLKVVFAALFLILVFYIASGLLEKQVEQTQNLITASHSPAQEQVLAVEDQKKSPGFPVRLKIPRINVDTDIQYVGTTLEGEMGVPNNSVDVGWYDLGPRPGEKGSAVIAGHLSQENNKAGVFTNLDKLKHGDKVYIDDSKGASIAFVVRGSRIYDPGRADEVFRRNDSAHLNLITCNGVWDKAKKSYNKRLVVFTDITH